MADSGTTNTSRPRQLALDLPLQPGMGREDFLPAPANEQALAAISTWPSGAAGESHALAIVGPAGSGKTHLAEIWRLAHDALRARVADLAVENVPHLLARGALVLEDLPGPPACSGAGSGPKQKGGMGTAVPPEWEVALFHLLNLARQEGGHVLITSRAAPPTWQVALPDLGSRLAAVPVARLHEPDDELLRAVLVKLFTDRQLRVPEEVISFLLMRMERSLDAAQRVVAALDAAALAERRNITRHLAARVLAELPG